ncbi:hypothetical protein EJA72_10890 [Pseudomonas sp. PB120]|uniref:hypothetical protein n=1 Tax=Pseudomonas sp. PB120 TaxID=2494700 RepID=UPI0012FDB779|nr:hypothetical protein [Pseudomonas sp. PB120]MVV48745.1 hypothetical protein [Pseudomonas sp. PB120]
MKTFFALSLTSLILATGEASAACTNITNTYSGTVPANSYVIAQGPFTVTGANGCRQANISSTIAPIGAGAPPKLFIDRLTGSAWTEVSGGTGRTASALGQLGTYRVRHVNNLNVSRQYSGTTRYGK